MAARRRGRALGGRKSIKETEDAYESLVGALDEADEGFFVVGGERILYANEAGCRMSGYGLAELRAMPSLRELFVPEDAALPLGRRRAVEGHESALIHKSGHRVEVEVTVKPLREDGARRVVVLRDTAERRRAEEKIRFQARLLKAVGQALVAIDMRGRIIYWNRSAETLYGWSAEEVVGRLAEEVLVSADQQEQAAAIVAELSAGRSWSGEFTVRRRDGTLFPVMVTDTPVHDEHGNLVGIIGVSMDITERKRSEELLRQQAAAMIASMDGVAILDENGTYAYMNGAHAEMFGYDDPAEVRGESWKALYDEGELERLERYVEPFFWENGWWRGEAIGKRRDGSTFPHEISLTAIEGGGTVCVARDVTERKEAEEALHASKERFRAIIEQSPMSIHIFAPDGRSLRANASWNELWNLREGEEPEGTNIFEDEQIHRTGLVSYVRESVAEQRLVRTPPLYYDPARSGREGSPRWLQASVYPVRGEAGNVNEMALVIEDITERKEAEENLEKSEERFRSMVRNASDVFAIVETDAAMRYISPSVERVLGYDEDGLIGANAFDYVHPDDRERLASSFARSLDVSGIASPEEFRMRHANGSWRILEAVSNNLSEDPNIAGVVVNARDVTARRATEEALRESEERFRSAFEDAPIGVSLIGLDNSYLRVNHALCEMLGYDEEALLAKTSFEVTHPDDLEASMARTRRALRERTGSYHLEKRYVRADGGLVWALSSVSLIMTSQGEPSHFVSLAQNITERKALEEKLEHQAFHDSLTELPNRALFIDRLKQALARMDRRGFAVAVLFMDLDNFKVINDSLGHEAGDRLLVAVGGRLQGCVRPEDTVARLGGDEFTILLESISGLQDAERAARRILDALREPFDLGGREVLANVSIGIAPATSPSDEPQEILRRADLALYEAKKRGKAGYEVFEGASTRAPDRLELENGLRRAIDRGELEVYYQPKVSVGTGRIASMEALVRWEHPERGLVEPEDFLPVAEESGLILEIGEWVLGEVCRQGAAWHERFPQRPPIRACTNVSARQLKRGNLAGKVAEALRETGLEAEGLSLEITEDVLADGSESTIDKLRELKDLGLHIVIQNFGVAHSSLVRLQRFPLNYMKIDRSLVVGLEDPKSAAVVEATINLAHALGWAVTAHGVETASQLVRLQELGCDLVQGYYFSTPVVAEEATALLQADFDRRGDSSS